MINADAAAPQDVVAAEKDMNLGRDDLEMMMSLRVVVSTRTGGGIGAGQPIVLNYGPGFDLAVARPVSDDAYLGALDRVFEGQRARLPELAEQNDEQKREEEEAQAAAEEEARRQAAEAFRAAEEKRAAKLKEEAEAKKAAEEEAQRAADEEEERKRRRVAVEGCDNPKRAKIEQVDPIVAKLSTSPCVLILSSDNKLVLRNPSDTNKKVSSDTVLVAWSNGTSLSSNLTEGFEYKLNFKSDIINQKTMKRMKMDKFISECGPPVREIFGFEPFPAGSVPKILIKKGSKTIRWEYTGEDVVHLRDTLRQPR